MPVLSSEDEVSCPVCENEKTRAVKEGQGHRKRSVKTKEQTGRSQIESVMSNIKLFQSFYKQTKNE